MIDFIINCVLKCAIFCIESRRLSRTQLPFSSECQFFCTVPSRNIGINFRGHVHVIHNIYIYSINELVSSIAKIFKLNFSDVFLTQNGFSVKHINEIIFSANIPILNLNLKLRGGNDPVTEAVSVPLFQPFSIPVFFLGDDGSPSFWLHLVEIALEDSGRVTSLRKFNSCITALPAEILSKIGRVAENISKQTDPFLALKNAILEIYREPKTEIFGRYFKEQVLGQELPTVFLKRSIEGLERLQSGITTDDSILRHFFLSALPTQTQAILAVADTTSLDKLAEMADKIAVFTKVPQANFQPLTHAVLPAASSSAISTANDPFSLSHQDKIVSALEDLGRRLSRIENTQNPQRRTFERSLSRGKSPNRRGFICHFHQKFRNDAKRCVIGCSWQNKSSDCQMTDVCIFHDKFQSNARRCLTGCKFALQLPNNENSNQSKN